MRKRREFFRITKFARKFDKRTGRFTINIAYKTKTDITDRTVAVSEAFGLGVDEFQKHVVYDNVELKIGPTDIVYITGDSGSGKSVLLRRIQKDLAAECINIKNVKVDRRKPLVDTLGKSTEEALELLSRVGLNDAFLFVRRYSQLSDGQKYRYRIAKMIESGKQYWIMDEFCATLDRDTAKIVAFNVQKLARSTGKAVLAATTHTDLFTDLSPAVHIHKRFGREIEVKYYTYHTNVPNVHKHQCTLAKEMHIEEGSREDYKKLVHFHYRQGGHPPLRRVFVMKRGEEPVGVILYCYSPINLIGRKKAFHGKVFSIAEVNEKFAIISRVVLHPKYRTIGLGAGLVRETVPLVELPYVEAIAVMSRYNPFFEKAGMQKIMERFPDHEITEAIEQLHHVGFEPTLLSSTHYNLEKLKNMNPMKIKKCRQILAKLRSPRLHKFADHHAPYGRNARYRAAVKKASLEKLAKMLKALSFLAQTKVYLLWKKPTSYDSARETLYTNLSHNTKINKELS